MIDNKREFLEENTRDRDQFLRELISELATTLQDVVGLREAEGFVKLVGLRIGDAISADYERGRRGPRGRDTTAWTTADLAHALVDLKRKIEGGFTVDSRCSLPSRLDCFGQ